MRSVLERRGVDYRLNEGDGAFYGPKIDFHIRDAIKRSWQCGTIQVDFQMPDNYDLAYMDESNSRQRPVIIHRAVYGSIDRFIGILTEHYAGAFPVWLSPVQATILPVSDKFDDYAKQTAQLLRAAGIRADADLRGEKLGYKIREAQLSKTPYMLIVGEKEARDGTVSVRLREEGDIGVLNVEEAVEKIRGDIGEGWLRRQESPGNVKFPGLSHAIRSRSAVRIPAYAASACAPSSCRNSPYAAYRLPFDPA